MKVLVGQQEYAIAWNAVTRSDLLAYSKAFNRSAPTRPVDVPTQGDFGRLFTVKTVEELALVDRMFKPVSLAGFDVWEYGLIESGR
jgi:hypothetical protein